MEAATQEFDRLISFGYIPSNGRASVITSLLSSIRGHFQCLRHIMTVPFVTEYGKQCIEIFCDNTGKPNLNLDAGSDVIVNGNLYIYLKCPISGLYAPVCWLHIKSVFDILRFNSVWIGIHVDKLSRSAYNEWLTSGCD